MSGNPEVQALRKKARELQAKARKLFAKALEIERAEKDSHRVSKQEQKNRQTFADCELLVAAVRSGHSTYGAVARATGLTLSRVSRARLALGEKRSMAVLRLWEWRRAYYWRSVRSTQFGADAIAHHRLLDALNSAHHSGRKLRDDFSGHEAVE